MGNLNVFRLFLFLSVLSSDKIIAQTFNLGFENTTSMYSFPNGWFQWGEGYFLRPDTVKHSGKYSFIIEPGNKPGRNLFGCVAYRIPAIYAGSKIELRGFMKLENVSNGVAGLLLRVDGASGRLEFDNMARKKISGTIDWKQYSVKLNYPKGAKAIYVGGLLTGSGKLWIDDFEVLIDGKNIEKIKPEILSQTKINAENEFILGSKVPFIKLDDTITNNLFVLGKLWGFLKYYHPFIAKGELNWDNELFRFLPRYLESKTKESRNQLLKKWISGFGKVSSESENEIGRDVKFRADLSWINKENFGDSLVVLLKNIECTKRPRNNHYIDLEFGVRNPIFQNEETYSSMDYNDAGLRILCLFRYWNMIEYYFPYKNLIGEDWNLVLKEFIPKFNNASEELNYKLTVLALIARVHDTHANIWGWGTGNKKLYTYDGVNYAPFEIKFIENKAVVTDFHDRKLTTSYGVRVGDIIETVNEKSIEDIIKDKLPLTPASNYPTQLRIIARSLLRTNDTLLRINFKRGDSLFNKSVSCSNPNYFEKNINRDGADTCFKFLSSEISYLYPGKLKKGELKKIMPAILNSKGLVIDFRCYPSDFIVFSLSEYLMPKPTSFVKFSRGSIEFPGQFTLSEGSKVGSKNKNFYKGKVIILVNEETQSSAEYHTMAFRQAPNAKVIGSTTAGADGNVSEILLPGGIKTMISGIGVYNPDGTETQRIGILPDLEIKPTIKGIKEGRDEVLEKAIELINQK